MIGLNLFWAEYALNISADPKADFMSNLFTIGLTSINEAALAFAIMSFDFKEILHGFRASTGRSVEIKAACNMVVFLKEIEACECDLNKDIIVVQRYFEVGR